ncbi:MAG: PadR family transcriptional regulator [Candidatus Taylorbacteria bacterium]|nr:PadR family transcriptional regulator [Candidatus Taylorbacteria bacterium]
MIHLDILLKIFQTMAYTLTHKNLVIYEIMVYHDFENATFGGRLLPRSHFKKWLFLIEKKIKTIIGIDKIQQSMKRQSTSRKFTQLRHGLLEFAVLIKIDSSPSGFYSKELLDELSKTEFSAPAGTIYSLLSKLRRDGLLMQSYEESDEGTPRKYHYLTQKGKRMLKAYLIYWRILNKNIRRLRKPLEDR